MEERFRKKERKEIQKKIDRLRDKGKRRGKKVRSIKKEKERDAVMTPLIIFSKSRLLVKARRFWVLIFLPISIFSPNQVCRFA